MLRNCPFLLLLITFIVGGCNSDSSSNKEVIDKVSLGAQLYSDKNLSNQRSMSCASCHELERGFVDNRFLDEDDTNPIHGALSVGDDGVSLGGRNAPSAGYAQFSPAFGKNDRDRYAGGQFWDGRAKDLQEQAKGPFLDAAEMQMPDKASVVARVQENEAYIANFKTLYGDTIFDDINATYEAIADAIAAFESSETFAPFDSKYDRFIACKERTGLSSTCYKEGNWSAQEELGYSLFFSEANTNCATCHTLNSASEASSHELFTNFEYENIGTPRNHEAMQARVDLGLQAPDHHDLGLGGRDDINDSSEYAKVKVPSLRNVAVTGPYMHNGVFNELKTVLEFYDHMGAGERPTNPETGEPWGDVDVNATINREELEKTKELTDAKIDALVAFLKTLTDQKYEALLK